jgi:hypothetical protein
MNMVIAVMLERVHTGIGTQQTNPMVNGARLRIILAILGTFNWMPGDPEL